MNEQSCYLTPIEDIESVVAKAEDICLLNKIAESRFYIPDYQRKYVWNNKQITRLFEDFIESHDKKITHYLGSIIFYYNSKKGKLEVIDGQQRLTSCFILALALNLFSYKILIGQPKDYSFFEKALNYTNHFQEISSEIEQRIEHQNQEERRCFTKFVKSLDALFSKIRSEIYINDAQIITDYIEQESQDNRFFENFLIFYKKIEETYNKRVQSSNDDIVKDWAASLKKIFKSAFVHVADEKDVVTVFNTINTTGVKLTSTDLINSFLICADQNCHDTVSDIEKKLLRFCKNKDKFYEYYNQFWLSFTRALVIRKGADRSRNNYSILNDSEDEGFELEIQNFRDTKNHALYESFKEVFNLYKKSPNFNFDSFTQLIEDYMDYFLFFKFGDEENKFFKHNISNKDEKYKKVIKLVRHVFYDLNIMDTFMPDLLVMSERIDETSESKLEFENFVKVMHLLWSFVIRATINKNRYGKITNKTINFAYLPNEVIYSELKKVLDERNQIVTKISTEEQEEFRKALLAYNTGRKIDNYLLFVINYQLSDEVISDKDSLEHIMPKAALSNDNTNWKNDLTISIKNNQELLHDFVEYREDGSVDDEMRKTLFKAFLECLGNKILLDLKINSSIKDSGFKEKLATYERMSKYKKLIEPFKNKDSWGFAEIIQQSNYYADVIYEITKVDYLEQQ